MLRCGRTRRHATLPSRFRKLLEYGSKILQACKRNTLEYLLVPNTSMHDAITLAKQTFRCFARTVYEVPLDNEVKQLRSTWRPLVVSGRRLNDFPSNEKFLEQLLKGRPAESNAGGIEAQQERINRFFEVTTRLGGQLILRDDWLEICKSLETLRCTIDASAGQLDLRGVPCPGIGQKLLQSSRQFPILGPNDEIPP